ncbi:MAG TPA: class I SAM-dependent methyltransferase [Longimicrobiales bacterium]|nr:class I SAM-dependent methyltransferase [Longimicrobiales bacterium]
MTRDFDLGGEIRPWGRRADEYEAFFALHDAPLNSRILDCAGGPASFAAEWGSRGHSVVAADPIYALSADDIAGAFDSTAISMLAGMRQAHARFRWDRYGSPEAVVEGRGEALRLFLDDLQSPSPAARYVAAALPSLPFRADSFDMVLCSHYLFLYSDELDLGAHLAALQELLRVGREVRVYPLLDMAGVRSVHLDPCVAELSRFAEVEIVPVPFEFRMGDTSMLRIRRMAGRPPR